MDRGNNQALRIGNIIVAKILVSPKNPVEGIETIKAGEIKFNGLQKGRMNGWTATSNTQRGAGLRQRGKLLKLIVEGVHKSSKGVQSKSNVFQLLIVDQKLRTSFIEEVSGPLLLALEFLEASIFHHKGKLNQ